MSKSSRRIFTCLIVLCFIQLPLSADSFTLDLGDTGGTFIGRMIQLSALMALLTLAPSIIVMLTSFTRIVVVFSCLRNALGTQQSPPNMILISLAMLLTFYVMGPVFNKSYEDGVAPLMENKISYEVAYEKICYPLHAFMRRNVREKDLELFINLSKEKDIKSAKDVPMRILVPSFVISELRRGFEIGFLIYLPFVVIDLVIASILMSMGMMMLPPVLVAMPFKIIFFVLIDGWNMLCGSLVNSFNT
jgi:flagellar biosynthetic protein FliP